MSELYDGKRLKLWTPATYRIEVEGEAGGCGVVIFDYGYQIEKYSDDNIGYKRVFNTICILNQDSRDLPSFKLRSKGIKDKLRDKVGLHDIDPGNDPEFAKHCWLTGSDEEAVRELFTPAVTQAFQSTSDLTASAIQKNRPTHGNHIPKAKNSQLGIFAVNSGTVGAFQIGQHEFFLVFLDFDMKSANPLVVELDRVSFFATNGDRRSQVSVDSPPICAIQYP